MRRRQIIEIKTLEYTFFMSFRYRKFILVIGFLMTLKTCNINYRCRVTHLVHDLKHMDQVVLWQDVNLATYLLSYKSPLFIDTNKNLCFLVEIS